MDGDLEASVVHFCLQKLHILPSEFLNLPLKERVFIIASTLVRVDSEKKAIEEAKKRT